MSHTDIEKELLGQPIPGFDPDNPLFALLKQEMRPYVETAELFVHLPDGLIWGETRTGRCGTFIERNDAEEIFNALQSIEGNTILPAAFEKGILPTHVAQGLAKRLGARPIHSRKEVPIKYAAVMALQALTPYSDLFEDAINTYHAKSFCHRSKYPSPRPCDCISYDDFAARERELLHAFLTEKEYTIEEISRVLNAFDIAKEAFAGTDGKGIVRNISGNYSLAHSIDVMKTVAQFGFRSVDEFLIPALVHDIGEDTWIWNDGKPFEGSPDQARTLFRKWLVKTFPEIDAKIVLDLTKPIIQKSLNKKKKSRLEMISLERLASKGKFASHVIKLCDRLCNLLDFSGCEINRLVKQTKDTDFLLRLLTPCVKHSQNALTVIKFIIKVAFPGVQMLWEDGIVEEFPTI